MEQAVANCGLQLIRLINEPTAAALYARMSRAEVFSTFMQKSNVQEVILATADVGSGTLDWTVLEVRTN